MYLVYFHNFTSISLDSGVHLSSGGSLVTQESSLREWIQFSGKQNSYDVLYSYVSSFSLPLTLLFWGMPTRTKEAAYCTARASVSTAARDPDNFACEKSSF